MHPPIVRNIEPETAPPSVLIDLAEFARIVGIAKPFASREAMPPIFTGIHFYERQGQLYAEATDRYALVRVGSMTSAPAGLSVVLSAADCAAVLARFEPQRGKRVKLLITLEYGLAVVALADGLLAVGADTTLTLRPVEGKYPALGHLFTKLASREPSADLVMFDPKLLGRLPGSGRMKVTGAKDPVGFFGDNWAAAIMPMRAARDGDPSKHWAA